MRRLFCPAAVLLFVLSGCSVQKGLNRVNHIIIVTQENHSFDNYLGMLAYAPGSPYHNSSGTCSPFDHKCVAGLSCTLDSAGVATCTNSNLDDDGSTVTAFHEPSRCVILDLDHRWLEAHTEGNFLEPNRTLSSFPADGFVRVNDVTEQIDNGVESPTDDATMGFYDQTDLPFYYDLAQKFAISDRYFSSVMGPTFVNRSYLMAATSFGHLTTFDSAPPPGGYKPITGTIFDLLNKYEVSWADFYQDGPQASSFLTQDAHFLPLATFLAQLAGTPGAGRLPQVSFIDPMFGNEANLENDEHPPSDIQRGQAYVSQVVNALRNGPYWQDSILFILYDEHGGFYDHVKPPRAPNPDGIAPGQCEDLSKPPFSELPGGGAQCSSNPFSTAETSLSDAEALCPALAQSPTGPYPRECASFNQFGMRVPLIAVSPFSKTSYVSHTVGDHTSLLALIEQRFLTINGATQFLTRRDGRADPLLDMFDFEHSPSLNTKVLQAAPPAVDCTPPFVPGPS